MDFFELLEFVVEGAVIDLEDFVLDGLEAEFLDGFVKSQSQITLIRYLIHIFIL